MVFATSSWTCHKKWYHLASDDTADANKLYFTTPLSDMYCRRVINETLKGSVAVSDFLFSKVKPCWGECSSCFKRWKCSLDHASMLHSKKCSSFNLADSPQIITEEWLSTAEFSSWFIHPISNTGNADLRSYNRQVQSGHMCTDHHLLASPGINNHKTELSKCIIKNLTLKTEFKSVGSGLGKRWTMECPCGYYKLFKKLL